MSELEQKILREISKTGFPLELRTASFLEAQGYTANHGLHYIDRDERKPREIDLRCSKALKYPVAMGGRKSSFVRHTFLVECKKSEKPWVIFTSDHGSGHDQNPFEIEIEGLQLAEWTQEEVFDACEEFESIHPLFKPRRLGRSLFEPFKQRQTGESIYSAILSASKATVAARSQSFPSFAASRSPDLGFYYPVVIFEGRLFEAHLDRNEISVEEVDSIMYSLLYQSDNYSLRTIVPIVTEEGLEQFCALFDQVLAFWGGLLKKRPGLFVFEDV